MSKIGIYPGTFDPIHVGHIEFAKKAIEVCDLEKVAFLPEPDPRAKQSVSSLASRIELIDESIGSYKDLSILQLTSTQFSTDNSLSEIQSHFADHQLALLIGSDVALGLDKWQNVELLLASCNLIIGMRNSDNKNSIKRLVETLTTKQPIFIETDYPAVSSSQYKDSCRA